MKKSILSVKNLKTYFYNSNSTPIKAVADVSFELYEDEVLGIVGESGCGKSVTSLSILQLIKGNGNIVDGEILFNNFDLTKLQADKLQELRGNEISMIFQDPISFLNPVVKVGNQVAEVILRHNKISKREAFARVVELFEKVKIPNPEKRVNSYPHELSGGLRQRVLIAIAIANNPKLLIADEPTTALDVTVQKEIIELLIELKKSYSMSMIFITHDLSLISKISDRVAVMYAGKIVEIGESSEIFNAPKHPYTKGLIASIPSLSTNSQRLFNLEGAVPSLDNLPNYCYFADRCLEKNDRCYKSIPELYKLNKRYVRCFLYE